MGVTVTPTRLRSVYRGHKIAKNLQDQGILGCRSEDVDFDTWLVVFAEVQGDCDLEDMVMEFLERTVPSISKWKTIAEIWKARYQTLSATVRVGRALSA